MAGVAVAVIEPSEDLTTTMRMTQDQTCLPHSKAFRVVVCPSTSLTGIAEVPL